MVTQWVCVYAAFYRHVPCPTQPLPVDPEQNRAAAGPSACEGWTFLMALDVYVHLGTKAQLSCGAQWLLCLGAVVL